MSSTIKKGKRLESKAEKMLKEWGYVVEKAKALPIYLPGGRIRTKSHDFFGVFDLIAVGRSGVRFIQVTVNHWQCIKDRKDKIAAFAEFIDPNNDGLSLELWAHTDNVGFEGFQYWHGEWRSVSLKTGEGYEST